MRQIATDSITRVSLPSSGWHQSVFDRFSNEKTYEVCVVIATMKLLTILVIKTAQNTLHGC